MRVSTCLIPERVGSVLDRDAHQRELAPDTAVVIDVLRATTVMVTALGNGATRVMTCREVSEAHQLADRIEPKPLLCGERGCQPIAGFDLGNSPAEYTQERVRNQTLVLTTTNGTRAIASVDSVPRVLIASFLNLSAVVSQLSQSRHVRLVCAGTEGKVTLEDVLLAGAILWRCQLSHGALVDEDDSELALQLWRSWFAEQVSAGCMPQSMELSQRFRQSRGGRNLVRLGFESDLERCARIDSINVVPERQVASPATFGVSK